MRWIFFLRQYQNVGNLPANCSTGHRGDNPRTHTTQETTPSQLTLNDESWIEQPSWTSNLVILGKTTGLEKSLDDVKWCCDTGRESTCQTTSHAVSEGIVFLSGVHYFRNRLVCHELSCGERDCHAEGSGIGHVESLHAFSPVDTPSTMKDSSVHRAMDLHALLNHYIKEQCQLNLSFSFIGLDKLLGHTYHRMDSSMHRWQ